MEARFTVKRCPGCNSIFNHSMSKTTCVKCGYDPSKSKKLKVKNK